MADRDEKTRDAQDERTGDKASERRARQAAALRRNLARRKAQARGRTVQDAPDHAADEDPSGN